jgi:hypothetical protein
MTHHPSPVTKVQNAVQKVKARRVTGRSVREPQEKCNARANLPPHENLNKYRKYKSIKNCKRHHLFHKSGPLRYSSSFIPVLGLPLATPVLSRLKVSFSFG